MKRRGAAKKGQLVKRRRAFAAKAQKAPSASTADLQEQLDRRTRELDEALRQQTATSEVLSIIRRSPADAQPVFDAIVESAARLCDAVFSVVYLYEADHVRIAATRNFTPDATTQMNKLQQLKRPERSHAGGRAILDRAIVHVPDVLADPEYSRELALAGGWRAVLAVPLLRNGKPVGALTAAKAEPKPFSDRQIQLLRTFADQALIAIENVRLFEEVQARTEELAESLQQQTATADVLKVISRSPGDLAPVFKAMLENAVHICEAKFGHMFLSEGEGFRVVALESGTLPYPDWLREGSKLELRENPRGPLAQIAATEKIVHIGDLTAEATYVERNPRMVALVESSGARTFLGVPMFKGETLVGAIGIYRQEVRPFTDKQIDLVENFAAQAVIAIENTRLLSELRESLQQQIATANVLKAISRSTFDLQTVLDTLVESATRLCGANHGWLFRLDGKSLHWVASFGYATDAHNRLRDFFKTREVFVDRGSVTGRAALEAKVVHVPDVMTDPEYTYGDAQKVGGYRAGLGVPLLRAGDVIGVIFVNKVAPEPFSEKQVELAATFADQAVIAIENVRLFEAEQQRTRELASSLENLRTTQDRLVQTQKLASLGQLTAGIAHEIKNPLNFVNNFSGLSAEMIDELREALGDVSLTEKKHSEITELMDTLRGNLDKVVQHGKRADAIVKNMLQHSREGSGEHRRVDINALVEESLNLAWHGVRAERQGFEITLKQSFDPAAGEVDLFPQDMTRALLNLISNGFYAATKRQAATNGGDYEPTIAASTKDLGDRVEIRIRDNGTGIAPDVKEKMFNPFFTTKPTGEGTGLGLSISHDIIVKQHAGSIDVDTQLGEFTEIKIILPRTAVFL
jgi:two-component system NtrC family sensor kinase